MPSETQIPFFPPLPDDLTDRLKAGHLFAPWVGLDRFVKDHLIDPSSTIHNRDFMHLRFARVRFAVALGPCSVRGKRVAGRAHLGEPGGSDAWVKDRQLDWLRHVFGEVPDFWILIDAGFIRAVSSMLSSGAMDEGDAGATVLALVEHELYHCDSQRDPYGAPKFRRDGSPLWRIAPHDVEEFIGVVRRYGADSNIDGTTREFVDTANRGPTIAKSRLADLFREFSCGSCK